MSTDIPVPGLSAQAANALNENFAAIASALNPVATGSTTDRDLPTRFAERLSVLDFIPADLHAAIANFETTTNVHSYIQAAIDRLELLGGGELFFPYGKYLIGAGLTVNKGVRLVGEGEIGDQTGSSIALGGTLLQWNSLSAGDMITIKSATANQYLYGAAVMNIVLYGASKATAGIRASSISNCKFHVEAGWLVEAGIVVDDGNGVLSLQNDFWLKYIYGTVAATESSHGLKFDGNASSVGVTQNKIHRLFGLVKNGWMWWLRDSDGNHAHTVHASVNTGGTGGGVYFANGEVQPARNNHIDVLWGSCKYESDTWGNYIGRAHSEAGGAVAVTPGSGHIHYRAFDYVNGEQWDTHSFVMSDEYFVPAMDLQPSVSFSAFVAYDPPSLNDGEGAEVDVTVTGAIVGDFVEVSFSNDTQGLLLDAEVTATSTVTVRFQNETGGTIDLASGSLRIITKAHPTRAALHTEFAALWSAVLFPDAVTTAARANVVAPYHWSDGAITGLKLHCGMDAANVSKDVRLRVRAITTASGVSATNPEVDENFTVAVADGQYVHRTSTITFGTPLAFTKGDFVGLRIERLGADAADTASGGFNLLGVSVLYEGEGPDSPGSGTWSVPPIGV